MKNSSLDKKDPARQFTPEQGSQIIESILFAGAAAGIGYIIGPAVAGNENQPDNPNNIEVKREGGYTVVKEGETTIKFKELG